MGTFKCVHCGKTWDDPIKTYLEIRIEQQNDIRKTVQQFNQFKRDDCLQVRGNSYRQKDI